MTNAKKNGYRWGEDNLSLSTTEYNEKAAREAKDRHESPDAEEEFYAGAVERRMRGRRSQ